MNTILIVGYGSIGKRHLKNILLEKYTKIIICTKRNDLQKLEENGIIIVNSIKKSLLHKPNIAFITNETSYHVKTAIILAENGVHLFIEKPLSHSIKDVKKLEKIVDKKGVIVQIGCDHRFHPCIKKIKNILDNKKIGKIISVHVENSSYLPDWHPYEDYRKGYAAKKSLGGGIALTMIHELDFLYWFFGDIKKVFSITGKYSNLEISADDLSMMTLIFNKNIIAHLHLDYFSRPEFKSCKIKGVNGTVYWNSILNEVKIYSQNKKQWKTILKIKKFERNLMFIDELKYFLKCIKNNNESFNNIDDASRTLQVVLNAKKSSKQGKLI
jgi:predicted dehydrogenase